MVYKSFAQMRKLKPGKSFDYALLGYDLAHAGMIKGVWVRQVAGSLDKKT